MNTLPQLGETVQIFGVGCEGCGNFKGDFRVAAVIEGKKLELILTVLDVHCEGAIRSGWFSRLTVEWNAAFQCWEAACGGHRVVINISRHFRGSAQVAA